MSDKPDPKDGGLVPTGNRALTTRSSALVRRGLEALILQQARIVHFPPDHSMGKFYICDQGADSMVARALLVFGSEMLGEASGNVTVPAGKVMFLKVGDAASTDLSPLTDLKPDDLYSLDLGWTQINDAGLAHIRGLTDLKELSLGGTKIADGGLIHLLGLVGLQDLSLTHTQIGDAGLAHLCRLTELQSLDLSSTQVSDAGLAYLFGYTRIYCRLDHFGEDGTECFSEGTIVYINIDHPLYKREARKADTRSMHIARLLTEEMALMKDPSNPHQPSEPLRELTVLQILDQIETPVCDTGALQIRRLTKLRHLDLSQTQVTDAGIEDLRGLASLEWLDLRGTRVSNSGLADLQRALPNCSIKK